MLAATAANLSALHSQPSDVLGDLAAACATKREVLQRLLGQQQQQQQAGPQPPRAPSPSSSIASCGSLSALGSAVSALSTPQQREEAGRAALRRHRWGGGYFGRDGAGQLASWPTTHTHTHTQPLQLDSTARCIQGHRRVPWQQRTLHLTPCRCWLLAAGRLPRCRRRRLAQIVARQWKWAAREGLDMAAAGR
jgi:hypothetical protein